MLPPIVFISLHVHAKTFLLEERKGGFLFVSRSTFHKGWKSQRIFNNVIVHHLLDNGNKFGTLKSFKITNTQRNSSLLRSVNAIAAKNLKLSLCIRKKITTQSLTTVVTSSFQHSTAQNFYPIKITFFQSWAIFLYLFMLLC